jgi:Lon protease-like protein
MSKMNRIPLFPLDVVLLPAMPLPLHIFEPRYKKMIGECWREHRSFGLVLAADKATATVGCTAEIVQKIREYADGRMDILTEGRLVFRLAEILDEKEYYEGTVEYLSDPPQVPDLEQEAQLIQIFERCHALLFKQPWADSSEHEPGTLAYRMAALLPMELERRQALLEMRSHRARRESVLRWMERFLPKLVALERVRERAGGNGHTLN